MKGEQHTAGLVPWQFFCTFTFKNLAGVNVNAPTYKKRAHTMFFTTLRKLAGAARLHFHSLLWVLREERGEVTGRYHLHALIAGFPEHWVNERTCLVAMQCWESAGGGHGRVRIFDASLDGVGYVLKSLEMSVGSGGNLYELTKFGVFGDVTLSKSLVGAIRKESTRGRLGSKQTRIGTPRQAAQEDSRC